MSTTDDKTLSAYDAAVDVGDDGNGIDEKRGNAQDRADMYRMGKAQEMKRNFRFLSIFGFSMILMASWEFSLSVSTIGLINGGTAGVIWMYFICWMGFMLVNLSMAEMASMAPTSGGQYHWVSEFAPRKHQKFISYLMGWMCVLGWQTSCASSAYISGTQIQGLVVMNYPNYKPEAWHGTLLTIAVSAFSVLFNTILARKLPLIEALVLIIHIFGFIGIVVTLWVLSPTAQPSAVFTEFFDGGGWGSKGGSALVGLLAGILPLLGADAAVHMSEELRDAGRTLPRSMIMTTVINGAMGWIMIITYCFCIGDLFELLETPTGYPFMQVFLNATGSPASATAMSVFVVAMAMFSNLTMVATCSRQLFAFARDNAVPYSNWFAGVPTGWDVPMNAIFTTFLFSSLLSLINIGSPIALNSITSLATTSLLSSYICSVGCMVWRRWTGAPMLPSKFSLGRYGLAINVGSVIFLVVVFVLAFFPQNPNPTPDLMNWNIVIYGAVTLFSLAFYVYRGSRRYDGPVAYVRTLE